MRTTNHGDWSPGTRTVIRLYGPSIYFGLFVLLLYVVTSHPMPGAIFFGIGAFSITIGFQYWIEKWWGLSAVQQVRSPDVRLPLIILIAWTAIACVLVLFLPMWVMAPMAVLSYYLEFVVARRFVARRYVRSGVVERLKLPVRFSVRAVQDS